MYMMLWGTLTFQLDIGSAGVGAMAVECQAGVFTYQILTHGGNGECAGERPLGPHLTY